MHDRMDWTAVHERLAAHAAVLESGALPPEQQARILSERAVRLAAAPVSRHAAAALHAVIFVRDGIRYGVDLARLREIQVCRTMMRLPAVPRFCLGVTNVRGEILPLFDLPRLFSDAADDPLPPQRILVVDSETTTIGIAADEVDDAVALASDEIEPPLATFSGPRARLIHGLARGALLLDCKTLIDSDALVVG